MLRILAVLVASLVIWGLTAISRVNVSVHESEQALLRVAFSARPERIETCRTLSDAELADVPQHMRQRVLCEDATATYRLHVSSNNVVLDSRVVRGGGLRNGGRKATNAAPSRNPSIIQDGVLDILEVEIG